MIGLLDIFKVFIMFFVGLIFNSCNEGRVSSDIQGTWSIEYMSFNGENYLGDLYANSFSLEKDNSCWFPTTTTTLESVNNIHDGIWKIYLDQNDIFLNLETYNEPFDGLFEIKGFYMLHDTLSNEYIIKMQIESDKTYIRCTQSILFGYNFPKSLPIVKGQHIFGQEDLIE